MKRSTSALVSSLALACGRAGGGPAGLRHRSLRRPLRITCLLALFLLSVSTSSSTAHNSRSFDFAFGIVAKGADGLDFIQSETVTLPLKVEATGFRWGYSIRERSGAEFTVKSIFRAPVNTRASGDLRIVGDDIVGPESQHVGNALKSYVFDEGDPAGDYQLEVIVDGRPFRVVKFKVVAQ